MGERGVHNTPDHGYIADPADRVYSDLDEALQRRIAAFGDDGLRRREARRGLSGRVRGRVGSEGRLGGRLGPEGDSSGHRDAQR